MTPFNSFFRRFGFESLLDLRLPYSDNEAKVVLSEFI